MKMNGTDVNAKPLYSVFRWSLGFWLGAQRARAHHTFSELNRMGLMGPINKFASNFFQLSPSNGGCC